jgi:hypothetical protein
MCGRTRLRIGIRVTGRVEEKRMKVIVLSAAAVLATMIIVSAPASARLGMAPSPASQDDTIV